MSTGSTSWAAAAKASSAIRTRVNCIWMAIPNATASCAIRMRTPGTTQDFRPPAFNDLIVYQLHFGVFYAKDDQGNDIRPASRVQVPGCVDRIEYFADLGVNAIMPLPFQEYQSENSLGYNGTDLFSPEMDYAVRHGGSAAVPGARESSAAGEGLPADDAAQLTGQVNQLKMFIDLCHLYGIAVIADVVYNHAGGPFDEQSLYFFDRQPGPDNNNSLYFLRDGSRRRAGVRVLEAGSAAVPDRQRQDRC